MKRWVHWVALSGLTLLSLVSAGYNLHQFMLDHGWTCYSADSGSWKLVVSGWGLIWYTWPALLLGAVVGVGAAWGLGIWNSDRHLTKRRAEQEEWFSRMERQREAASERFDQRRQALFTAEAMVERREQDAQQRIAQAEARTQEAELQRSNAVAVTHKRRKQLETLREKTQTMVEIEDILIALVKLREEGVSWSQDTILKRIKTGW